MSDPRAAGHNPAAFLFAFRIPTLLRRSLGESSLAGGLLPTYLRLQASSPEAIRRHAYAAALPVDEIVAVADTVVVRPDPAPVGA